MNSVNIYLEANPNPNSLKFVADRMLLEDKEIKDYPDSKSAGDSQIARELFKFDYVERVFIMSNFITITKNEQVHWDAIKLELRNFIKKYLEEEKPANVSAWDVVGEDEIETMNDSDELTYEELPTVEKL